MLLDDGNDIGGGSLLTWELESACDRSWCETIQKVLQEASVP